MLRMPTTFFSSSGGLVKSVQAIQDTIAATSNSNTATISAVDTANTVLFYNGQRTDTPTSASLATDSIGITLTNSTTVTAVTNTANPTYARYVNALAVEFNPGVVNSVQYGTVTITGTTGTATISSVNTTYSSVMFLGQTTDHDPTPDLDIGFGGVTLTDSTTVTGTRGTATDTLTIYFVVVEWNSTYVKSVQQKNIAIVASGGGGAVLSAIDTASSLCVYGGQYIGSSTTSMSFSCYGQIASSISLTANRISSSALIQSNAIFTAVEFYPSYILQQSNQIQVIGGTTENTTVSGVNLSSYALSYAGYTSVEGLDFSDSNTITIRSTSATNVRTERQASVTSLLRTFNMVGFA